MRGWVLALALAREYVIVSSPSQAMVMYWQAPESSSSSDEHLLTQRNFLDPRVEPQPLINDGLTSPVGIAVDQSRHGLYVTDPGQQKIYRYIVTPTSNGLEVGSAFMVVSNYQARWLVVDTHGNLFFTDEQNSAIYKVPASDLVNPTTSILGEEEVAHYNTDGVSLPIMLYDGAKTAQVSAPGGIAVDGYRVFWANKVLGTEKGSVVQGLEKPSLTNPNEVVKIAENAIKVYGVCISATNIFFTDDKTFLYGVKKVGGGIATISEKMKGPRGCAFDGDGTVYVADETGNAVMSFPANMAGLAPQKLHSAFKTQGPAGVAVFKVDSASALALFAMVFLIQ
jgi:DNA-binding beta-propeller fold protein YncE